MTLPKVTYYMLDTGYCLAHEHHMLRGGRHQVIDCHSLVALLEHPVHGWGLWDTGYAPRMLTATTHWPYRAYRYVTPLRIRPEQAVCSQLSHWRLTAADINWIVLSHMHADHIAGLLDFPHATVIVTSSAYHDATGRRGVRALCRCILPDLLPLDLATRARLIHSFPDAALPALGPTYDIWGDGSLQLVNLPGHARGQVGMLANTTHGRVFFAADGCWLTRAAREDRLPHPLTYAVVDDLRALRSTLHRLHAFTMAFPDVQIIPTHCPEAFEREVVGQSR